MSTSNIPKALLFSPGQTEGSEDVSAMKTTGKFQDTVRVNCTQSTNEMHQNRVKNLRKELEYIKETEWKYEPIEKYIGQS